MLINEGSSGREGGSQGSVDLVDHLIGWSAFAGPSAFIIARCCAHRAGGQERPLYVLRECRKRLPGIGFTRKVVRHKVLKALTSLSVCWRSCLSAVRRA